MQVSSRGFRAFAATLRALADELCEGRLVLTLEGGYDLDALGESVAEVVGVLCEEQAPGIDFPPPSALGRSLVDQFRSAHAQHWPSVSAGGRR